MNGPARQIDLYIYMSKIMRQMPGMYARRLSFFLRGSSSRFERGELSRSPEEMVSESGLGVELIRENEPVAGDIGWHEWSIHSSAMYMDKVLWLIKVAMVT